MVIRADFPLNDGGMFYATVEDILSNHWRLPATLSYNFQQIPMVYPPLGFYLIALIHYLTNFPLLELFRWVPVAFYSLSVILFYGLSRNLFKNKNLALFSTILFSLVPSSANWMLMGGGITRAMGMSAALGSLLLLMVWLKKKQFAYFYLSSFLFLLTFFSHFQWFLFSLYSISLLLFFYDSKQWLKTGITFFSGPLVVVSLWLLYLTNTHNISTLLHGLGTNNGTRFLLLYHDFTDEMFFPIIKYLGILSLIWTIGKKKWFYAVWFCCIVVLNPRGVGPHLAILFALVIPLFLSDLFSKIQYFIKDVSLPVLSHQINFSFMVPFGVVSALLFIQLTNLSIAYQVRDLESRYISRHEREALAWIKEHTSSQSTFIVLAATPAWYVDGVSEWFPVLAQRQSVLTPQGLEWTNRYKPTVKMYEQVKTCAGIQCVEEKLAQESLSYDYIYLTRSNEPYFSQSLDQIYSSLHGNPRYHPIYEKNLISIWMMSPDPDSKLLPTISENK